MTARVLLRSRRGVWATTAGGSPIALHAALRSTGSDVLALQYNPFSYGHWGVAPGLIAELLDARRRGALRRLVLVVHEPFVVLPGLRYTLMGAVQRAQLAVLLRMSTVVVATSSAWLAVLARVSAEHARRCRCRRDRTCRTGAVDRTAGPSHARRVRGARSWCRRSG